MMLRYAFRIVLPYVNTDSLDYHACAIGVTRETRYTSTDKRLLINNKTNIDMKHQIYALTTALIITIIGLIVTIDYFNGEVKRLDNDIQSLRWSIQLQTGTIENHNDRIIRNENRIRCFGTTIYGSYENAETAINRADEILDSLMEEANNIKK